MVVVATDTPLSERNLRHLAARALADLTPGLCITIPVGTQFQFRATGTNELHLLIATMPPRPGAHEALPVAGYWEAS